MRAASNALIAHLNALRTNRDASAISADCFTFRLRTGLVLTYTNSDASIAINGYTYLADSVLVDGLRFRCSTGLEVDQQQVTISARPTDVIGGTPALVAICNGMLDGAEVQRERVFLAGWGETPIGSVILFKGRVGSIDYVGRTSAQITVNSELISLDVDMPRNLYAPNCQHTLFDSGCGLNKNSHGAAGVVGVNSTRSSVQWSNASVAYAQGTITFSSGLNSGVTASIKAATSAFLTLGYPLPQTPSAGDVFTAYLGCDHTLGTCRSKFNNVQNFRGFPFIPNPTSAV
jgi:uncharacterized phage protein (TIGR02218 family)